MAGYVIKVTLEGCKPPVWRNVRIPKNITFKTLHEIIQVIFGWSDMHLHEFMTNDKTISIVSDLEEDDEFYTDYVYAEENTRVNEFLQEHKWIRYTYDFGSEWRHKIALQKIEEDYPFDYAEVIRFKGDNFVEDSLWDEEDEYIDEVEREELQRTIFELEVVNEQLRDMDYDFSNEKPQDMDGLSVEDMEEFLKTAQIFEEMFDELPEEEREKLLEQMNAMASEMDRMEQVVQKLESAHSTIYKPKDTSKSLVVEILNKFRDNWESISNKGKSFRWEISTEQSDMQSWMQQCSEIDLRNHCRYSGFDINDDMGKQDYLKCYMEGMKNNPMFILAYMYRENIECLLRIRKDKQKVADHVFMETCFRASVLGLMEVENCKKKEEVDARLQWTKEGEEILDYLEKNSWKKQMEVIENYSKKIAMLIHVYGIMDFDFVFNKIGEIWKNDLTKEELRRILYCQFNFNLEARTYHSDFDGKDYVIDCTLDLNSQGNLMYQFASDIEYYPYTRKDIECSDSGFNMLHMCWTQMQFILANHSELSMMEITELIDFSYNEARKGKTPSEILEAVIKRARIKSHMLQFYLWDTLMTCCLNTGLPMLKGYTRIQLAEKKKLPVMTYGLFQEELPINFITKATPIYKMHASVQMDIYKALEIQDVDEAVEELQCIENAVCKGNYEIRFAQISMYFDRGYTEELKPMLEKLKRELGNNDMYLLKFYREINEVTGSYDNTSPERSWLDRLFDEEKNGDVTTYRRQEAKIGRNALCPCGSGKKYKKCCGVGK